MARLDEIGDEEFVGYTFRGPPERRARLWFLQRHLNTLFTHEGWAITNNKGETGTWNAVWTGWNPVMVGPDIRYVSSEGWVAVWRLTHTVIRHVHTFGRDDDVWRLGVWPD